MGQAQINVRTRACSRTSIARTKQAALTHNVRGKELILPLSLSRGTILGGKKILEGGTRTAPNYLALHPYAMNPEQYYTVPCPLTLSLSTVTPSCDMSTVTCFAVRSCLSPCVVVSLSQQVTAASEAGWVALSVTSMG